jgi:hypothetical protein
MKKAIKKLYLQLIQDYKKMTPVKITGNVWLLALN